jgi:PHD/YefM family antitoxin component YafN of YafNO toxin-antitoxin module
MTEREAALLANPEVLEALKRGIAQAKAGDYVVLDLDDED